MSGGHGDHGHDEAGHGHGAEHGHDSHANGSDHKESDLDAFVSDLQNFFRGLYQGIFGKLKKLWPFGKGSSHSTHAADHGHGGGHH